MIRPATLQAIEAGEVDLAFRRWDRPRVVVGTRMRTGVGLIEVTSVDRVAATRITAAEARRAGSTLPELRRLLEAKADKPVWRVGLRHAGEDPRIALRNAALHAHTLDASNAGFDIAASASAPASSVPALAAAGWVVWPRRRWRPGTPATLRRLTLWPSG